MSKIEEFLSNKAKSPAPHLQADPYLPTKIAALAEEENTLNKIAGFPNWSFASAITACAIVLGIYLGLGILQDDASQYNIDIVSEYSEAFYQDGFADNYDSALEDGGIEK